MSRPIFSAGAAVTADLALASPRQARHRPCELERGLRIIEGRVCYSAAWLDLAACTLRAADADTRSEGQPKGGLSG